MKIALLLSFLLTLPSTAFAQTSFTMLVQNFNEVDRTWGDTIRVAHFWKDATGLLDSMYDFDHVGSIVKTYDWQKCNMIHEPEFPSNIGDFWQLGIKGSLPRQSIIYALSTTDTVFQGQSTNEFVGENLVSEKYHQVEGFGGRSEFEYTLLGELSTAKYFDSVSNTEEARVENFALREYDSLNRVISATRWIKSPPSPNQRVDSQTFVFNADNTIRNSVRHLGSHTLLYEFDGWQSFHNCVYPFESGPSNLFDTHALMSGGNRFLKCSYYYKTAGDPIYRFDHREEKRYNGEGLLESDLTVDSLNQTFLVETSYYGNGDIKDVVRSSNIHPNTLPSVSYENDYNPDGTLRVSIYLESGKPTYRFLFTYHTLEIISQDGGSSVISSVGSTISLPLSNHSQHVQLINIAGQVVLDERSLASTIDASDLSSGLYFISIDGGRPRKHLIP